MTNLMSYTPSTPDELAAFISEFVTDNFRRTGRNTDGAFLAGTIKRKFPELTYEKLGVSRFADVIAIAEQKGLISRNRNVQHLEVTPVFHQAISDRETNRYLSQRVKPNLWKAFVSSSSTFSCLLNRKNGKFVRVRRSDFQEGESVQMSDKDMVEIVPIPTSTQRSWATEFLAVQAQSVPHLDLPDGDDWWESFQEWLNAQPFVLKRNWAKERTEKVASHIRDWAKKNNIGLEFIFEIPTKTTYGKEQSNNEEDQTRRAIIATLSDMPLEHLEQIEVPIRYMLRHFKVR